MELFHFAGLYIGSILMAINALLAFHAMREDKIGSAIASAAVAGLNFAVAMYSLASIVVSLL